jgi:hypothetical protein
MSAASFIGMAGTLYLTGYGGLAFIMGWTGGYCLVALFLAPYLRKFGQFTIPDFLGARYGGHLPRLIGVHVGELPVGLQDPSGEGAVGVGLLHGHLAPALHQVIHPLALAEEVALLGELIIGGVAADLNHVVQRGRERILTALEELGDAAALSLEQ